VSGGRSSRDIGSQWARWAGRGNGQIAADIARPMNLLLSFIEMFSGLQSDLFPSTIRGRVRHCRRGGYEAMPGAWREGDRAPMPVSVVLNGVDPHIECDTFDLSLGASVPVGILDYPHRPRAVTSTGTELACGVVLRVGSRVAELLLLRKSELAVIAILAGWPPPADLPHGLDVAAILGSTS
jgi:hypothetical protein